MTESLWHGFKRIDFKFEGREAILVFPNEASDNKNWLFKTEYFDAFPNFEIEMVKRGWHLTFIKNVNRWCLDENLNLKKRFATYLREEYGLYEKCVPVGMSCGGLIGSKFAAKYPECVSALYLDAPVMNLLSCPGDSDDIVPYEENGAILEKYYRENGGVVVAIGKENCGHHPHGLTDNTPIVEFVEKHCK